MIQYFKVQITSGTTTNIPSQESPSFATRLRSLCTNPRRNDFTNRFALGSMLCCKFSPKHLHPQYYDDFLGKLEDPQEVYYGGNMKITTVSSSDDELPIVTASTTFALPVTSWLTLYDWDSWLSEHHSLADSIRFYWSYSEEFRPNHAAIDPVYYIGENDCYFLTDFTSLSMSLLTN